MGNGSGIARMWGGKAGIGGGIAGNGGNAGM